MTIPTDVPRAPLAGPGVVDVARTGPMVDPLTVAAISVLAFAFSNVLHEGLGHGGACVLVGGAPRLLTTVSFDCGAASGSAAAIIVAAAGTVANLIAAGVAAGLYRRYPEATPAARLFLWLFASISAMQGFGYLLFSGVGRIGDWAEVMAGVHPEWAWRLALASVGFALYWAVTARAFATLGTLVGGAPGPRVTAARRVAWTAYATGGALYLVAGALNPGGYILLAISAAAASLGGTSGLAWGVSFLRAEPRRRPRELPALRIARDMRIITTALVVVLLFVAVLGPGVRLGQG